MVIMKKLISAALAVSMICAMSVCCIAADEEKGYFDTPKKAIPKNLMTSGMAIDGQASTAIGRKTEQSNLYEQYTVAEPDPNDNVYTFHGSLIAANNESNSKEFSSYKYLSIDKFEAGKTYVYQAMVKNMNEDYTPYYGIAHPNGIGGTANNIASNTYGKTGMAVTSTD